MNPVWGSWDDGNEMLLAAKVASSIVVSGPRSLYFQRPCPGCDAARREPARLV
jgi:hypothetical protein